MKLLKTLLPLCCFALSVVLAGGTERAIEAAQEGDKLVYADFETMKDNRPVSNRGGFVHLFEGHENPANRCSFKGAGDSDAPEVVRPGKDSPNKAIAFDYYLPAPNQWASVTVEINGQADKDGKPVADDVSGYKAMMLQLYVTGVSSVRVEFISRGQGIQIPAGSPQMSFKVSQGFNTYKIPLNSLSQPAWVENRINPKDLLKKLTAVSISVFCEQCVQTKGTVVVDNIYFQK